MHGPYPGDVDRGELRVTTEGVVIALLCRACCGSGEVDDEFHVEAMRCGVCNATGYVLEPIKTLGDLYDLLRSVAAYRTGADDD